MPQIDKYNEAEDNEDYDGPDLSIYAAVDAYKEEIALFPDETFIFQSE